MRSRYRHAVNVGLVTGAIGVFVAATLVALGAAGAVGPSPAPLVQSGKATCTTDSGGYCTVSHELGQQPDTVLVTASVSTTSKAYHLGVVAGSLTPTTFRVRAMASASTPASTRSIEFFYAAYGSPVAPPAPTSTTTAPPTTTTTPPTTPPPPPPVGGWPTPNTVGVPAGTDFVNTINGDYEVTTPGAVIDKWHVTGNLIIKADGVAITNSQIDDSLFEESLFSGPMRSFVVRDSTIGTAPNPSNPAACPRANSVPNGIGFGQFTAERVKIQGHTDGWQVWGNDVVIKDSYFQPCVFSGEDHADGVQDLYDTSRPDFPYLSGYLIEHNTIDFRVLKGVGGYTAPLFITGATNVTVRNNLMAGGTYTYDLYLRDGWSVTGNRSVSGASDFGDYETGHYCNGTEVWSDNDVVTVDSDYVPTSTVIDNVPCPT